MHRYFVVDVFTDTPLRGNPLAVFPEADALSGELMQRTARELNLSETVFILSAEDDAGADVRARIFTPKTELPFAGHPVLGTAFVVAGALAAELVRIRLPAGLVLVRMAREGGEIVYGEMEQPIPGIEPFGPVEELLAALGAPRPRLPVEAYRNGPVHLFVELDSEEAVAALRPDLRALEALGEFGVSCFWGAERRYKSRMFAPGLGVAEDPATGSAAGPLAVHLARHGRIAYGEQIEIHQGVEIGRPALLHARVDGSAELIERVAVGGSAVIVARGEYRLA